jgi:TRAP-type C4-dicarboxylate transport system permease small subunit
MEKAVRWLEQAATAFAGLCVIIIMLVISYDAIARYLLHAPLPWAFDLVTYYLMIVAIYFALSPTFRHGDHLNIDIFQMMLPRRVRVWTDFVCTLLAAAAFAVITYGTWMNVVEAYENNEFLPGIIVWPAWLSHLPVPIGTALIFLRLAHHSYMLARFGEDPFIEEASELQE